MNIEVLVIKTQFVSIMNVIASILKDLLYSFLDDSDYGKEETDINAELPL